MAAAVRCALFCPGGDARKMARALESGAGAVIFDLEDAVAEREKEAARRQVRRFLDGLPDAPVPAVWVRVNPPRHPAHAGDLELAAHPRLAAVVVPKVESPEDLPAGLPVPLVPMLESARGILRAHEILAGPAPVLCAGFGALDFALDLGLRPGPDGTELLLARSQLTLASRAAGVAPPLDSPFPDFHDDDGLRMAAAAARRLGFGGMLAIHPRQVPLILAAFQPTPAELERARRVVAAYEAALARGSGVADLDGQMIDLPVYEAALRTVATSAGG